MKNNHFYYKFQHNTLAHPGFTWAVSIYPIRSDVIHYTCPQCGSTKHYPSGSFDVILEGGNKYPDILGCGAFPFLIVSEKTIRGWNEAGVCCFHTHDVGIAEVKSSRLEKLVAPQYFRVEIDGSCQIDIEASGAKIVKFCPECFHLVTRPTVLKNYHIAQNSWDGSALFRDPIYYPRVNFCTKTVVEISTQKRLTNFQFAQMGSVACQRD